MRRRTVLGALLGTLVGAAGCGERSGPAPGEGEGEKSPTPEDTATDTPTPAATRTEAPTAAVDVASDGPPTHGPGERFVVEGSPSVAYTAHSFARADRLGPIGREPSQGAFVVADVTVETLGSDPLVVPIDSIRLRGGVRLVARQDDTDAAAADDRVDGPPLTDETLFPQTPLRGVLAYDLPTTPENDYYVQFDPVDAEEQGQAHRVPVGPLADVPRLER